jgi:hypothetical protein
MCYNTPLTSSSPTSPSNLSSAVSTAIKGCENLTMWISRLKAKEAILKSNRSGDLRREVLLLKATKRAQEQLEFEQRLNRQRWIEVKAKELKKCDFCFALLRFCSCKKYNTTIHNMEADIFDDEESKKIDDFFQSLSTAGKKRKQPSILKNYNVKRVKA